MQGRGERVTSVVARFATVVTVPVAALSSTIRVSSSIRVASGTFSIRVGRVRRSERWTR